MQKTFATKTPILNKHAVIINPRNQRIPVNISTSLLRNHYNEVIGCVEIIQDLRRYTLPRGNSFSQVPFEKLITRNQKMGRIIKNLSRISTSKKNVFIEGETGTGKEVLARAIHALSFQRKKPFISVNCATLQNTNLVTEIFSDHSGFFRCGMDDTTDNVSLTRGSTLYLNEIDETSKTFQKHLARLLQENWVPADNGNQSFCSDIRVIASSRLNLLSLMKNGGFNQDLYHHINAITLMLPPLRDRKEDIPLLIDQFISSYNRLKSEFFTGLNQEALDLLVAYNYPENITELKHIIGHALASCKEGYILPTHLPEKIRKIKTSISGVVDIEAAVQNVEAQTILTALKKNNYNRTAAARDLGIHKSTFFRKIKQLGIVLPQIDGRFRSVI